MRANERLRSASTRQAPVGAVDRLGWNDRAWRRHHYSNDVLRGMYEYFLTDFTSAEDKNGGQFYMPS
jgi:type I restriction-modification system DNA methylase subunit